MLVAFGGYNGKYHNAINVYKLPNQWWLSSAHSTMWQQQCTLYAAEIMQSR